MPHDTTTCTGQGGTCGRLADPDTFARQLCPACRCRYRFRDGTRCDREQLDSSRELCALHSLEAVVLEAQEATR